MPILSSKMKTYAKLITASVGLAVAAPCSHAAPVAENWDNLCAQCHGADGKGQTKVGKKIKAKDYTDPKVQAELKDADMEKVIVEGARDKAGKETMKGYKDQLSPQEMKDLVAYVRKFKG